MCCEDNFVVELRTLFKKGKQQRIDRINQLISLAEKEEISFILLLLKGYLCIFTGDYFQGIDHMKKAINIDPDNHIGWVGLGNAFSGAKDYMGAMKAYQRAINSRDLLAEVIERAPNAIIDPEVRIIVAEYKDSQPK